MGKALMLKVSSVLWVIWGLVHVLAGVMTVSQETPGAVQGIADAIDPTTLDVIYPAAAGAIINQHGFNLLWIGLTTTIAAYFVWKQSKNAVLLAALVGGLADVGYFIFIDLGGFARFVPGTLMTIVSGSAIVLSFTAVFKQNK